MIRNAARNESGSLRDVLLEPAAQVVEYHHFVTARNEFGRYMRPHKSGSAGNKTLRHLNLRENLGLTGCYPAGQVAKASRRGPKVESPPLIRHEKHKVIER